MARASIRRLLNLIRFDTYVVFSARVDDIVARPEPEDVTLRQLTSAEVSALTPVDEDIGDAMERCGLLADRAAFGAFCNGTFAHISWMIAGGPDGDRIRPPRLAGLRPGEAEITYCVTLPEYRGRQIYPFVISRLFQEARARGIREIFMVARSGNLASQRGILKAGLNRVRGRIYLLHVYRTYLVFRSFRMWRARGRCFPEQATRPQGGRSGFCAPEGRSRFRQQRVPSEAGGLDHQCGDPRQL